MHKFFLLIRLCRVASKRSFLFLLISLVLSAISSCLDLLLLDKIANVSEVLNDLNGGFSALRPLVSIYLFSSISKFLSFTLADYGAGVLAASIAVFTARSMLPQDGLQAENITLSEFTVLLSSEVHSLTNGIILPYLNQFTSFLQVCLVSLGAIYALGSKSFAIISGFFAVYIAIYAINHNKLRLFRRRVISEKRSTFEYLSTLYDGYREFRVFRTLSRFIDNYSMHIFALSRTESFIKIFGVYPKYVIEILGSIAFLLLIIFNGQWVNVQILDFIIVIAFASSKILPAVQVLFANINAVKAFSGIQDKYLSAFSAHLSQPASHSLSLTSHDCLNLEPSYILDFSIEINLFRVINPRLGLKRPIRFESSTLYIISAPSGFGKSTFFDSIVSPSRDSRVSMNFKYVSSSSETSSIIGSSLCDFKFLNFSYLPQRPVFIPGTILDNILIGRDHAECDFDVVFQILNCGDNGIFSSHSSHSLDSPLQSDGTGLSGGQLQRVALARSLAFSPKLFIADEPMSALDSSSTALMLQLIADLVSKNRLCAIIASHNHSSREVPARITELSSYLLRS